MQQAKRNFKPERHKDTGIIEWIIQLTQQIVRKQIPTLKRNITKSKIVPSQL